MYFFQAIEHIQIIQLLSPIIPEISVNVCVYLDSDKLLLTYFTLRNLVDKIQPYIKVKCKKNCEMHYRGEELQFASWFLTSILLVGFSI